MENRDTANGRRSGLPWLLALCFVGLAVLFRFAGNAVAGPADVAAPASAHSAPADLKTTDPGRPRKAHPLAHNAARTRDINPDGYLIPGDDFSAIEGRLAERVTYDERALLVMYHASAMCRSQVNPEWRTKAKTETGRIFSAWKESFCHGRTTADESRAYIEMTLDSFLRRHEDWDDRDKKKGTSPYFEAVLNSDSPEDVSFAADLVALPGLDTWDLGLEDVEGTTHVAHLARYQQVALQGIQCSELGGCGPNELMTMWLCLRMPASSCRAGASVDDMWANEFAPDEIAIIARIQQRILDERARRVASSSSKD